MASANPAKDYTKLINPEIAMTEAFELLSAQGERAATAAKLNPDDLGVMRTFAHSAALLAVRRNSPYLITQGLIAVAILGSSDEMRDLTFYLSTLHYSARKLGVDTEKLFRDASALSPSVDLRTAMREFPFRAAEDRGIQAFGLRETNAHEGFDFIESNSC
jgi:hypothetical protein